MTMSDREYGLMLSVQAVDAGASAALNQVSGAATKLSATFQSGAFKYLAVGQILSQVGRGAVTAGKKLLDLAKTAGMAAMDFDHEMALVQTQARLTGDGFDKLGDDALRISSKYGVAATDIARGLYDIFSTTDDTQKQATAAIDTLAKASIAGAVDIRTATRGVIDIQNAFGKSAGSTTDVLNLQFQMLRKSGGEYGELVTGFGNVISAASQMDQTMQTAAGSIAFLTLRGRTQAQASISVSRALDQISKSAKDVKATLGVSVFDAQGNFRQLNDIITDMSAKMAHMTSQERAKAFYDMFGAGSIQANRFFRIAVPQADKLNQSIDDMSKKQIADALNKAFNAMRKNDPSYIFHKLTESLKNLGISIANTLAPAFADLVKKIQGVIDWFNNLDDSTKEWIGKAVIIGGVVLVVVGTFLKLAGALSKLMFFAQLAGQAVGGLMGIFGSASLVIVGVIAAVVALAAAAYLIYKNWGSIKDWWKRNWDTIKAVAATVGTFLVVLLATRIPAAIATMMGAMKASAVGSWFAKLGGAVAEVATGTSSLRGAISGLVSPTMAWAAAAGLVVGALVSIDNLMKKMNEHKQGYLDMVLGNTNGGPTAALAELKNQLAAIKEEQATTWNPLKGLGLALEQRNIEDAIAKLEELGHLGPAIQQFGSTLDEVMQSYRDIGAAAKLSAQDQELFASIMEGNTQVTKGQATKIAQLIHSYENLTGKGIDPTMRAQLHNLVVQGDEAGAIKLLQRLLGDQLGVLKNMVPVQKQVNEKEADHAVRLLASASAQKALNRAEHDGLGALRNMIDPLTVINGKLADMANKSIAAKDALDALNHTPTGGGHHGNGGNDGGSNGGNGGSNGRTTGRTTTDRSITVNVRDHARGKEIAREIDWMYRTGTW